MTTDRSNTREARGTAAERYGASKREAIRELRHAIEQVQKDQHLNANYAATVATLRMQECFGIIRSGEKWRDPDQRADGNYRSDWPR